MNGSLMIAQVQELKENLEILKNAKAEQQPGAPIDLLTPYHAVSKTWFDAADLRVSFSLAVRCDPPGLTIPQKASEATDSSRCNVWRLTGTIH